MLPNLRETPKTQYLVVEGTTCQAIGYWSRVPSERSITVGIEIDDVPVRALAHELAHWLDYEGHGGREGRIAVHGLGWTGKYVQTRCFSEVNDEGTELVRHALNDMNSSVDRHYAMMHRLFPVAGEKVELTKDEKVTRARVGATGDDRPRYSPGSRSSTWRLSAMQEATDSLRRAQNI